MSKTSYVSLGVIITILTLAIHFAIIDDYGLTWDFHHHFFAGAKFLGFSWMDIEPRSLPYASPDPRFTSDLPYGPIISIVPFYSYLKLYKTRHLLQEDSAYHLPNIFIGVSGIIILFLFMRESLNLGTAVTASLFLMLMPRYFGDMHNNIKDIPISVVFTLNIYLLWRYFTYKKLHHFFWAVVSFALAFNTKVNSIFIPVVFSGWIFLTGISKVMKTKNKLHTFKKYISCFFPYFIFAPLAAFLLWGYFWSDPVGQLKLMTQTFGVGTNNLEVLLNGTWYCSGKNVPWYYPYWYLAITTPLPILFFFVAGLIISIYNAVVLNRNAHLLFLLWFFVPLLRYLSPSAGVIDGIRHFEEVVFPLVAISAIGCIWISKQIRNIAIKRFPVSSMKFVQIVIMIGIFSNLIWNIISYHPYQISYFNELVGGAKGAMGKYDLDYWGTSQKKAVLWLNENAPKDSTVYIVMAADVAARYLREDLLTRLNTTSYDDADYVVVLNRQSFFYRYYVFDYILKKQPIHTVSVNGTPLTWIFDSKKDRPTKLAKWWQDEDPCIWQYWKQQ